MSIKGVGGKSAVLAGLLITTTAMLIALIPTSTQGYERSTATPPRQCAYNIGSDAESDRSVSKEEIPEALYAVSYCESRHTQYDSNGKALWSRTGTKDLGRWQINVPIWGDKAEKLGYDLRTERGNFKMALWIYKNKGIGEWSPSSDCLYNNFGILIN